MGDYHIALPVVLDKGQEGLGVGTSRAQTPVLDGGEWRSLLTVSSSVNDVPTPSLPHC